MDDSNKKQFGLMLAALAELYEKTLTKQQLAIYFQALQDLPIDEVGRAVGRCAQFCKFMPKPADIRERCEGTAEDQAAIAWNDVLRAQPLGSYRHVSFDDTRINAAIRMLGGWPTMFERCATAESEKFYRLDFIKAYKTLAQRQLSDEAIAPLPGISECSVDMVNGVAKRIPPRVHKIKCAAPTGEHRIEHRDSRPEPVMIELKKP